MKITEEDKKQLDQRGIALEQVQSQFESLAKGIPFADLRDAATDGNGILILSSNQEKALVEKFDQSSGNLELLKFTPASGAATRMFKFLFQFYDDYNPVEGSINAYINKKGVPELRLFFVGLDSFPFYKKVRKRIKKRYSDGESLDIDVNRLRFIKILLNEDELNFGNKPKGLFPFHRYKKNIATAFEEHLFEGASYAAKDGVARLHFTISEAHLESFQKQFEKRKDYVQEKTATTFDISYSFQSPATDTVALASNGELLRDKEGQLVFRPGGHGALINNLNEQDADVIFIKNIDNVVVSKYRKKVAHFKKMLAGKLLEIQEQSFAYLHKLDDAEAINEQVILEIATFLQNELFIKVASDFERYSPTYQVEYLRELLDRPLRVCGMVKNEGEPGGGPFWVRHENGKECLQIVESVQINPSDNTQQQIVTNATHFNPVDIVCGVKNYKGEKYDLLKFVDYKAGFIASKSYEGQKIKALEHPGLWNGGMAHWNTIFIEVPLLTFNPVKTVNDLLKPAHQVR